MLSLCTSSSRSPAPPAGPEEVEPFDCRTEEPCNPRAAEHGDEPEGILGLSSVKSEKSTFLTKTFHARRLRVNLGGEFTKTAGLGAVLSRNFEKSRFYRPKVRIANPQISRGSGAQWPSYIPTRVLHATVPNGSGPTRKHTAKFEPPGRVELGPNDERFRSPKTRFE